MGSITPLWAGKELSVQVASWRALCNNMASFLPLNPGKHPTESPLLLSTVMEQCVLTGCTPARRCQLCWNRTCCQKFLPCTLLIPLKKRQKNTVCRVTEGIVPQSCEGKLMFLKVEFPCCALSFKGFYFYIHWRLSSCGNGHHFSGVYVLSE